MQSIDVISLSFALHISFLLQLESLKFSILILAFSLHFLQVIYNFVLGLTKRLITNIYS